MYEFDKAMEAYNATNLVMSTYFVIVTGILGGIATLVLILRLAHYLTLDPIGKPALPEGTCLPLTPADRVSVVPNEARTEVEPTPPSAKEHLAADGNPFVFHSARQ